MEPNALRAFFVCDVVDVHADRIVFELRLNRPRSGVVAFAAKPRSVDEFPSRSALVDCVVRAFWLASTAIDAFIGYHNRHGKGSFAGAKISL